MDARYDRRVTIHDIDPAIGQARVKKTRWISERDLRERCGKHIGHLHARGHQVHHTPGGWFTSYQLEKVSNMTSFYAIESARLQFEHSLRTVTVADLAAGVQAE
jgi:hypothetical protein